MLSERYQNKRKPLVDEYQTQKQLNSLLTYKEFCSKRNITPPDLCVALKLFGIKCQDRGGVKVDKDRHQLVNRFRFDGNMLGDGSIIYTHKTKNKLPCYSHSCKYPEYLKWLSCNLEVVSNRPIWSRDYFDKRTSKTYTSYWIKSLSSEFLKQQRDRWYPKGIKEIPSDIEINQELLLHWYLDDGSLATKGGIYFAADDISFENASILQQKVENYLRLTVTTHINEGKPRLYIKSGDAKEFFHLIGNCPVACYKYKWRS